MYISQWSINWSSVSMVEVHLSVKICKLWDTSFFVRYWPAYTYFLVRSKLKKKTSAVRNCRTFTYLLARLLLTSRNKLYMGMLWGNFFVFFPLNLEKKQNLMLIFLCPQMDFFLSQILSSFSILSQREFRKNKGSPDQSMGNFPHNQHPEHRSGHSCSLGYSSYSRI